MKIESRIGELIEESGLKTKFIAEKCKVSNKQVWNWKKGISYPTFEKTFILAYLLKCKVDDLAEIKKDLSD